MAALPDALVVEYEEILDTFQWAYPDRGHNRGEVRLYPDEGKLGLLVCVEDNDTDDEMLTPFVVKMLVDPDLDPAEMIRLLIHTHVTHEVDEQLWVNDQRPFYPEHQGG